MTPRIPKLLCTLFVSIWVVATAVAQQVSAPAPQTGTIIGTVLDTDGRVVAGASVVLQGPAPGDEQHLVAQDNGFFEFDGVKPGIPWHVTVSAPGFANWTSNDIVLEAGQYFNLTGIQLRIATVEVTVNVLPPEELAAQQLKVEESQRLVGFIPNFYVVYDHNPAPLTPKMKFHLAFKTLTDPVTTVGFLINTTAYQAAHYPDYQEGAKGYGERLGATLAGGYTRILVGDALMPSLLHQDPRYFYQGTGTTKSRLLHALSFPLITRGDDGRREINFSNIVGDLASGAMANAYYPSSDRGPHLVFRSALIGVAGRMLEGVLQEFVFQKYTSRRGPKQP